MNSFYCGSWMASIVYCLLKINRSSKMHCKVCFDSGKSEAMYTSHCVYSRNGVVVCPTLLKSVCRYCHKTGHMVSHCSVWRFKQSSSVVVAKEPPRDVLFPSLPSSPPPVPIRTSEKNYLNALKKVPVKEAPVRLLPTPMPVLEAAAEALGRQGLTRGPRHR